MTTDPFNSVYMNPSPSPRGNGDVDADGENRELPPGTVLGQRYRLGKKLGSGGFGIVYEAENLSIRNSCVAVKEFFPERYAYRRGLKLTSPQGKGREAFKHGVEAFAREAQLLSGLHHANIVPVKDYFQENDTAYLVMTRLHGRMLESIIDGDKNIGEARIRAWLLPLLSALQTLHAKGIYHMDISPRNVFICDHVKASNEEVPVLIDFGAARQVVGQESQSMADIANPGYSPIELYGQYSTASLTPATDIYSLGATLYHVVTGNRPAAAPDRAANDRLRRAADVAPGRYSQELLASIDIAMAFAHNARFADAAAWRTYLELPPEEKKQPLKWYWKSLIWMLVLLGLITLINVPIFSPDVVDPETLERSEGEAQPPQPVEVEPQPPQPPPPQEGDAQPPESQAGTAQSTEPQESEAQPPEAPEPDGSGG